MTISAQQFANPTQVQERRLHPRILPKSLIYVACGEANGGMVLNASDDGLAISMAIPVGSESFSSLDVCMKGLPQSIETYGRMVWTTTSKKRAGIQLVDVTDSQREQIREWIALEGVREVYLIPRPALLDATLQPLVVTTGTISPMAFAEPRSSLLDAYGGTAPESLGPAGHDDSAFQSTVLAAEPPQGLAGVHLAGFRDSEWDLAAVTLVPRKKPKPEGLSVLALTLLWIAIPSFGIGILVGRRPLEQWLSSGDAVGKNILHVANRGAEAVHRDGVNREEQPSSGRDTKVVSLPSGHANLPSKLERMAPRDSATFKSTDAYQSADHAGTIVDAELLNSMSTQEARALPRTSRTDAQSRISPVVTSQWDANAKHGDQGGVASKIAKPLPESVSSVDARPSRDLEMSPGWPAHDAVAKDSGAKSVSSAAPLSAAARNKERSGDQSFSDQNAADHVAKTISIDSEWNVSATKIPVTPPPAVTTSKMDASIRPAPPPAPSTTTGPGNTPSGPTATSPSATTDPRSNVAAGTTKVSPTSVSASNAAPSKSSPSNAAPPAAPSVAPSPIASSAARSLAPVRPQPPLRGEMLVARKNDETFLLKLPLESVPVGQSASIRMQRFVMVPPPSRWHRRGPIAKLIVGELLTPVAPDKPDAGTKPGDGDTITVRAFVDKNGSVQDLRPVSGRFALLPRVMRAVREWQFDQTLMDGKPVETEVNVTVEFRPLR